MKRVAEMVWTIGVLAVGGAGCGLTDMASALTGQSIQGAVDSTRATAEEKARREAEEAKQKGIAEAKSRFGPAQEDLLGGRLAAYIERRSRAADAAIAAYVQTLSAPLLAVAGKEAGGRKLAVKILDDLGKANAFEIPGGTVYLYSGLLLEVANRDELAGVIAHELGHAVRRHALERLIEVLGTTTLLSAAGADLAANGPSERVIETTAAGFMAGGAVAVRSHQQELDADDLAIPLARAAGYGGAGLARFLERTASASPTSSLATLLSTHPSASTRVSRLDRALPAAGAGVAPPRAEAITAEKILAGIKDVLRTRAALTPAGGSR